jgi:hypothetical protein
MQDRPSGPRAPHARTVTCTPLFRIIISGDGAQPTVTSLDRPSVHPSRCHVPLRRDVTGSWWKTSLQKDPLLKNPTDIGEMRTPSFPIITSPEVPCAANQCRKASFSAHPAPVLSWHRQRNADAGPGREVAGLIPSQGGVFWWLGPNLETTNVYSSLPDWTNELWLTEFQGTYRENEVFRPFRQFMTLAAPNHVHQFGELLGVDYHTFLRSDYYNVICRPSGCDEVLMLRVRESRRTYGALYLFRAAGKAPVEPRNIKILESIAGFVAHGM